MFVAAGVVALLLIALLIATVVITIICYIRKRKNHKLNTVNIGELSENRIFITMISCSLQCFHLSFVFKA